MTSSAARTGARIPPIMDMQRVERREFQRLRLETPIAATFGATEVSIVEIGVLGARLEHASPIEERGELQFAYGGNTLVMRAELVRLSGTGGSYTSGMRFLAAVGASGDHLRDMLAQLVVLAMERNHESSMTRLRIRRIDGDKTVRGADTHFVSYQHENGSWKRRHVLLPEQPAMGFTVPRGEDPDEMQRLCAVYEASDEEGRRLIRLFAELSVSGVLQIPPQM
jgi:hypothetical protein